MEVSRNTKPEILRLLKFFANLSNFKIHTIVKASNFIKLKVILIRKTS